MTLSWAGIRAAVDDLIESCVSNPLTGGAIGGRAYLGGGNNERGKTKRPKATASNALPPGANITLFQQLEISSSFPPAEE